MHGESTVEFLALSLEETVRKTFTIRNPSDNQWTGLSLRISGARANCLMIGAPAATSLAPGESTTFELSHHVQNLDLCQAVLYITFSELQGTPFELGLIGGVVRMNEEVVYQDTFDNDGLDANTRIGGGMQSYDPAGGPWLDNGELDSNRRNAHELRGNASSIRSFTMREGFKLNVVHSINFIDDTTWNNHAVIGLIDAASLPSDQQGNEVQDFLNQDQNRYGIGLNLTRKNGTQGLNFADGVDLNRLSNAQNIQTGTQSWELIVDGSGNWSYSIDGAAPTSGSSSLDLERPYHFYTYMRSIYSGRNDLQIHSVKLTKYVSEMISTAPTVWNVNIGTEVTTSDNYIGAAPENTPDSTWNSFVATDLPSPKLLADSLGNSTAVTFTVTGSPGLPQIGTRGTTSGDAIFKTWLKSPDNKTPFTMTIGGLSFSRTYDLVVYSDWWWKGNATFPVTQTLGSGLADTVTLDQISTDEWGTVSGLVEDTDPQPNTDIEGNWIRITGLTPDGSGNLGFSMGGTNAAFSGFQLVYPTGAATYGTWAATNAGGQSASEDFDNDGVENGIEYFMGETGSSFTADLGAFSFPLIG